MTNPLVTSPGVRSPEGTWAGYLPVCPSAAFTGTRASNGDGILHILGNEMLCWGTLGVVIVHRQPSQSFDARGTSAVEYARVS